MNILAQSTIVNIAPYLHVGYVSAGPPIDLGLIAVLTLLVPILVIVMLYWFDETMGLLRAAGEFLFGLTWRILCILLRVPR